MSLGIESEIAILSAYWVGRKARITIPGWKASGVVSRVYLNGGIMVDFDPASWETEGLKPNRIYGDPTEWDVGHLREVE